ncbi:MAG: ZPR1 zinc finger domain-containing protein [Candidatus Heimdallarchaeota archaeon]|nr:ZPR1 zinc finger domain-containing protein [Candidatus Heimdallarchaeota archaeon]MCG3257142.1 ZPR1 zinc finger domain-containing protein [Candidatus Heimdallarchaeota archaeon]MCK4612202.1 ZPR1 zinc finger domain-containing protein [Candidatus Heimdallarchaeota archaeon]
MTTEEHNFELMEVKCPVCNSTNTKITQKIMDIPHFPQLWFFNMVCSDCHFKHNDFINLSFKDPIRYIYHAENKDDYTTKIIRAANGTIIFPQIGAMIEPGPNAEGFINNIEGILHDIRGKAFFLLGDAGSDEEREKIRGYVKLLDSYIKDNLPIDIVVEDPFGNSSIIPADPNKLETIELSQEEAEKLKTGFIIFESAKDKVD